jgi:hypothetical protein
MYVVCYGEVTKCHFSGEEEGTSDVNAVRYLSQYQFHYVSG